MTWNDWANLLLRWTHLIAGIAWIGSSFYFIWLDRHLEAPRGDKPDVEGQLWMVHSGGFYLVERKHIGPGGMPQTLHWFKYEALVTWLSGAALLTVVYYLTGGMYLVDSSVSALTPLQATGLGIGTILAAWVIYDGLWESPLAKSSPLATTLSLVLAAGATVLFCETLSGRAAFIHVGAMFGTLMVANVWHRILPAQQRMIDATQAGRTPDYSESDKAKRRSVHNSYMTFPVLFIMVSNHFPATYSSRWSWVILLLLTVAGAAVRHTMIAKNATRWWALAPAAAAFGAVIVMTTPLAQAVTGGAPAEHAARGATGAVGSPPFTQVRGIIGARCLACHSAHPTDAVFVVAPSGVMFDDPAVIQKLAPRILARAVQTKTMPLANKTGITEEERSVLGRWITAGAPIR